MKALAVDTATPLASVAALEGGRLLGEAAVGAGRSHSEHLLQAVQFLLGRLGWSPAEIDLYVVTTGPGSFTGLRIGIGTVRGLAMAAGRPAAGVSTLRAMATALGAASERLAPILDAGRGEVYAGLYSGGDLPEPLREDAVVKPAGLPEFLGPGPVMAFGSGAERYAGLLRERLGTGARILPWRVPLAAGAGQLACRLVASGHAVSDLPLSARYIRRSDARLPGGR